MTTNPVLTRGQLAAAQQQHVTDLARLDAVADTEAGLREKLAKAKSEATNAREDAAARARELSEVCAELEVLKASAEDMKNVAALNKTLKEQLSEVCSVLVVTRTEND